MKIRQCLSYDDVLLAPQYSGVTTRREVSIGSGLDSDFHFSLPIISSPMDTITEAEMCVSMASYGGLGIIHRYNSIEDQVAIVKKAKEVLEKHGSPPIAAAVGISDDYLERASELYNHGVRVFCLDVAHGHHVLMEGALHAIKSRFTDAHIMAGNVATKGAFEDLAYWGANSIRVGIGGGSICSTRLQTGHGIPTLQSIMDCSDADVRWEVSMIADGGIRTSGDIVKALAAGANFVMLGSLLAGTSQTPGNIMTGASGKKYKAYRGMASKEAQYDWRGRHSSNEGISTTVPYRGSVIEILHDLIGGIKSGLSYSGAKDIYELQAKAEFVLQTGAGQAESGTHILGRK